MNSVASHHLRRPAPESTITTLSIVMIALIAAAIVMLARSPDIELGLAYVAKTAPVNPQQNTAPVAKDARMTEIEMRFQQAVVMLHAEEYEHALTALHRVLALSPRMPEAYVNMGYALLGLKRYKEAGDFFMSATNIRPYQGNAYWGLAIAYEEQGDLTAALGAMRTYIHLAQPDDPFVRRARSALWEWETALKRGPLPEEEAEWIKRRTQEWEDRNSPRRDMPQQEDTTIETRSLLN